jgi:hypothetical protein
LRRQYSLKEHILITNEDATPNFLRDRKYWIRLNTTIQQFSLPIDIWAVGKAAY